MRLVVKKRLTFLAIAISVYTLGFNFLPQDFSYDGSIHSIFPLLLASLGYFILVPILHWFLIIKAGQDKWWKIFIILSISSACARYSFPTSIAEYFDFIAWLRYPIIAVLLMFELYLMVTIIKGLWGARNLSGDPRVHAIEKHKDNEKSLAMALTFSWEPTTWYYAIPRFSKNHVKKLTNLNLASASRYHWLGLTLGFILLSSISYQLLIGWSQLAAIIVSSLIFYTVFFVAANYRVASHFSIYIKDDKLVINNAFWGLMTVDTEQISGVETGLFDKTESPEILMFGRGKIANLRLTFNQQQTYFGGIATFPEKVTELLLNVDEPELLVKALSI